MNQPKTSAMPPAPKHPTSGMTDVSQKGAPTPRLPHERDESSDSQQQVLPDERVEKAGDDLRQGHLDTGRSPVTTELSRQHFPGKGEDKVNETGNDAGPDEAKGRGANETGPRAR